MAWQGVIGLEIHVQLATNSKIFSGASTAYGADPNTQACAIDLGLPGVLPVLNEEAVRMAVKFGLAINANIARQSVFERKNYFYPDLPKGYQISQYELPIVSGGGLTIDLADSTRKHIGITRAHLEEDAGKSLHEDFQGMSGIDLNRAGTPLLEVVSDPDMRSAKEAVAYMKTLHSLVRYLGICDGNMQEGSFRCDANVSVRRGSDDPYGVRTELKNLNSFRFVERAIDFELGRQIAVLESGGSVQQETRLYDADKNETRALRTKEEANDYRYFPDPDLLPLELDEEFIAQIKEELPELPEARRLRFQGEYNLSASDTVTLIQSRELADFFEATVKACDAPPKLSANWIVGELTGALNKSGLGVTDSPVSPQRLGGLMDRICDGTVSGKLAKEVFQAMWQGEGEPDAIIRERGLKQVTDTDLIEQIVDRVLADNPAQVAQYRGGKKKVLAFFVGQVMKATGGKLDPGQVNTLLKTKLADPG